MDQTSGIQLPMLVVPAITTALFFDSTWLFYFFCPNLMLILGVLVSSLLVDGGVGVTTALLFVGMGRFFLFQS